MKFKRTIFKSIQDNLQQLKNSNVCLKCGHSKNNTHYEITFNSFWKKKSKTFDKLDDDFKSVITSVNNNNYNIIINYYNVDISRHKSSRYRDQNIIRVDYICENCNAVQFRYKCSNSFVEIKNRKTKSK